MSRRNLLQDSDFYGSDSKQDYDDDYDGSGNGSGGSGSGSAGGSLGGSLGEPPAHQPSSAARAGQENNDNAFPPSGGETVAQSSSTVSGAATGTTNGASVAKRVESHWTPEKEQLLKDWAQQSLGYAWMHERSAKSYNTWHTLLSAPAVILSSGVGVSVLGVDNVTSTSRLVQATVSLLTGAIISLQAFLKYEKAGEQHMQMYRQFVSFHSDIITELALPRIERHASVQYINDLKKKWKEMIRIAPNIPSSIIDDFSDKMKKFQNISKPFLTFPGEEVFEIKIDNGTQAAPAASVNVEGVSKTTGVPNVAESVSNAASAASTFAAAGSLLSNILPPPPTVMRQRSSSVTLGDMEDVEMGRQGRRVMRQVLAPVVVPSVETRVESPPSDQMNQLIRQSIEASKRAVMAEKRRRSAQSSIENSGKRGRQTPVEYSSQDAHLQGIGSAAFQARRDALLKKRQLMQNKMETLRLGSLEMAIADGNMGARRIEDAGGNSGSSNESGNVEYRADEIVRNVLEKPDSTGTLAHQQRYVKRSSSSTRSRDTVQEESKSTDSTQCTEEGMAEVIPDGVLSLSNTEYRRARPPVVPRVAPFVSKGIATGDSSTTSLSLGAVGGSPGLNHASPRMVRSSIIQTLVEGENSSDVSNIVSMLSIPATQRRQTRETRSSANTFVGTPAISTSPGATTTVASVEVDALSDNPKEDKVIVLED